MVEVELIALLVLCTGLAAFAGYRGLVAVFLASGLALWWFGLPAVWFLHLSVACIGLLLIASLTGWLDRWM